MNDVGALQIRINLELVDEDWLIVVRRDDTAEAVASMPLTILLDDLLDTVVEYDLQDLPNLRRLYTEIEEFRERFKDQI